MAYLSIDFHFKVIASEHLSSLPANSKLFYHEITDPNLETGHLKVKQLHSGSLGTFEDKGIVLGLEELMEEKISNHVTAL